MGDITDRPKAPKPQVVYVPQYVSTPAPAGGTTTITMKRRPPKSSARRICSAVPARVWARF